MKKIESVKLIKIVRSAAHAGLNSMPVNRPVTARQVCGSAVWDSLTRGQRIYAGRVLRAIVALGYIDLNGSGHSSSNHRLYTLT
jgi:hypothetical protein